MLSSHGFEDVIGKINRAFGCFSPGFLRTIVIVSWRHDDKALLGWLGVYGFT